MRSLFLFPALHSLTVTELCQQFSSIAQCHITLCLDFSLILCSICSTRKNLNMSSILSSLVKFDHWSPENTYQDTQRQPSGPCCSWEFSHWCFGVKVKVQTWELYQSSNVTLQPDPCRFLQTLHFFQLQFSFCLPSLRCVDFSGEVKAQIHLVRVWRTTCSGFKYTGWPLPTWLQMARLPSNIIWLLSPQTHLEIVSGFP